MSIPFASQHTESFPAVLDFLGVSVLVSTYQAGQLIILRSQGGVRSLRRFPVLPVV